MLLCRLTVVVLHGLRVTPFAQVVLAACGLCLLPANLVCLSPACSDGVVAWGAAPQPWSGIFTVFYMGSEPQTKDFAYAGFRYLLTRKYLLCVFLYVLTFHYGRPAVRITLSLAADLRRFIDGFRCLPKSAKLLLPRVIYGLGSTAALVGMSVYQSHHFGALEDNWVMEASPHFQQATLPHLGLLVIYIVAQICFMAGLVSALPNVLHWIGSQTLGSYVAHSYVNLLMTVVFFDPQKGTISMPSYIARYKSTNTEFPCFTGTKVQILTQELRACSILLIPLLIQLFIGPLVQKALFFHLQVLSLLAPLVVYLLY
jgi:hypothetical protein